MGVTNKSHRAMPGPGKRHKLVSGQSQKHHQQQHAGHNHAPTPPRLTAQSMYSRCTSLCTHSRSTASPACTQGLLPSTSISRSLYRRQQRPACTAASMGSLGDTDYSKQQTTHSLGVQQQQEQQQQQQQQQQNLRHKQQQQQRPRPPGVLRRLAVIECEDAEKWRGYTESLWRGALEEEGDQWVVYQACKGQLPTVEEAQAFDALLISGSHYSVYEQEEWIKQLLLRLKQYADSGVRMYGCCFGCQALAQALGGSVGPNPSGHFVLTIEQITPTVPHTQQYKQLSTVLAAALQATADVASPPAAAEGHVREAAAVGVAPAVQGRLEAQGTASAAGGTATAAAGGGCDGGSSSSSSSGDNGSSGGSSGRNSGGTTDAQVDAASEQLTNLSITVNSDSSNNSSNSSNTAVGSSSVSSSGSSGSVSCAAGCFRLIESHGDQVLTVPPGAVVLAFSPTAPYELWAWGSSVLASQFHLEFDEPLVIDKIWTRLTDVGRLNEQQSQHSRRVLEAGGQHNLQMLQVVKHFLRHGVC